MPSRYISRDGEILETGTPSQIVSRFPYGLLAVSGSGMYPLLKMLRTLPGVAGCFSFGDSHHLSYDPEVTDAGTIVAAARQAGFGDCSAREIAPGIEDRFMQLSGKWTRKDMQCR